MEKIIDLAESPEVATKRFRELVTAAVEKFNQGALGAALWMLDVAEDSIPEKKLDHRRPSIRFAPKPSR